METGAEAGVTRAGARGRRRCRREEAPPWSPQRTPGPAGPRVSDFSLQGRQRAGSCCFKAPVCGPLLQQAQDAGPRGLGSTQGLSAACGCLAPGLGEAGGVPASCSSSHSGLLLPRLPLSPSHVLRRGSSRAGGQGMLCASLGDGEGLRAPPGQPIPLVVLGLGGASF